MTTDQSAITPGLRTRMTEEFRRIADDAAARNTRTAIVVPGPQIVEAMSEIFSDVPHIPDYDPAATPETFTSYVEYASDVVPDDPIDVAVHARPGDGSPEVTMVVTENGQERDISFDPDVAERFFLAGLAACNHARQLRDRTPVD